MEPTVREVRPTATGRPRRRAQTWLFSLALLALALGTVAGVLLARQRAADTVDERAEEAAEAAAALLGTEARQVFAGLAGADAIVDSDGELDLEVFEAFAAGLLTSDGISRLALLEVVPGDGAGGAAAYRAVDAVPPGVATVGRDFGEDAVRRAALDATVASREPMVTGLLALTIAGEPGVAFLRPLAGPDGTVAGVIDTAVTQERIDESLRGSVGPGMAVALVEDGTTVVGPEFDPRDETFVASLDVPGREWQVVVRPGEDADLTIAWLVGAGGLAATLAMAALLIVTERHQRAQNRANLLLARSEERSRAAQEVAGRLARALTGAEVAGALVDHLPAAVGARSALIATMDPRSGALRIVDRDGAADVSAALPAVEPGSVVDQVLADRRPAWLSSPLGWRHDEVATRLAGDGSAMAVLPLLTADVAGVLAVSYPQFHIFGDDEQALLGTVGVLAAQALARGQRYDAEHQAAVAFQQAALPDALPVVDGLTIAARYRPATHGATVGGDWYDVLVLDEHRVMLVVGDVVGHGMVAAAAMGRLRTAFQTIVPFTRDPGEMLRAIGQQVGSIPDAFCATVVTVVVDLRTGEMSWSRAGHPPPLHVDHEGAHLLDSPGVPPLGVVPETDPPVHRAQLRSGDMVILYTDGVVERRTESLDQGFQRLGIVTEQLADLAPEELCDALVEALVPAEEQTDDLAVLVVRFDHPQT